MCKRLCIVLLASACGGGSTSDTIAISSVTPNFGPLGGGTRIVISGSGFLRDGATPDRVLFGSHESPQAGVVDDMTLEAVVPAGDAAGDVPITVFNRNGNVTVMSGAFKYSTEPVISSVSPSNVLFSSDNTTVTITGSGFKDEDAGVVTLLVDGDPAIDVQVQSDTQLTFTAKPGQIMSRPDLTLTDARGTVTKPNAFRYVPSMSPGFWLFPRQSQSTFAVFYDPMSDQVVTVPKIDTTTPQIALGALFIDTTGDIVVRDRGSRYGTLDFETQQIIMPTTLAVRVSSLSKLGGTMYAVARCSGNNNVFGTFDPVTLNFTQISVLAAGCGRQAGNLVNNGSSLFLIQGTTGISTINTTTGARGTVFPLSVPNLELGEARFMGSTLFAVAGPSQQQNLVIAIDPANGTVTTKHTFPPGTALTAMEVFNP